MKNVFKIALIVISLGAIHLSSANAASLSSVFLIKGGAHCTGFMVGNTCAVSAGHCRDTLDSAHFNAREESETMPVGEIFEIDQTSIQSSYDQGDGDWAVFKVKPRSNRAVMRRRRRILIPGIEYGKLAIDTTTPVRREMPIHAHGYGLRGNTRRDYLIEGEIIGRNRSMQGIDREFMITTQLRLVNGDSGSPIINSQNGKVIGIASQSTLVGTELPESTIDYIPLHQSLQDAINDCLDSE